MCAKKQERCDGCQASEVAGLSARPFGLRVCYSGGDGAGLPSVSASASKIRCAGNSQGILRGHSFMIGTSFGQLPEEISLLTSTAYTASCGSC